MSLGRKTEIRVAIVGRPNVGKSTLFNRLLGRKRALVHNEPGVTRDRLEQRTRWWVQGTQYSVSLIDTGGLGGVRFADEIQNQVEIALSQANAVVALFDAQSGLVPTDQTIIRELKRKGVGDRLPIFYVVNKVDAEQHESLSGEFFELGLHPILTVSAEHGRGIDDLQHAVIQALHPEAISEKEATERESEISLPQIAVVGRPNVGKSTFVNALLGEERMITSPVAGTTVDAVDSLGNLNGKNFIFIDTAGIRKKSKTERGVEVLSVVQTKKALERADIAILLLDGEQGITDQDEKIGGLIEDAGCGVILALNKWDTQLKNKKFTKEMAAERIRKTMAYLSYAPILFVSAKDQVGFGHLGDLMDEILSQRRLKIPTHEFTEWVRLQTLANNPQNAKFYLCHQASRHPPTFVCHVNNPKKIHFSLKRHLINALRERWGYMGNPIRMLFVEGKKKH